MGLDALGALDPEMTWTCTNAFISGIEARTRKGYGASGVVGVFVAGAREGTCD